jgi:peptide/nickel transport system permease protein
LIRFIARRTAWALFVVWVVVTCVFMLVHVIGDPASATLGAQASPEQVEAFQKAHKLDQPLLTRYGEYLHSLVRLDLGTSFQDGRQVSELILTRLPRTMLLGAMALSMELVFGLALGVLAALFKDRWLDTFIMMTAFVGISLPTFVTGLFLLSYVAFQLGLFPVGGYGVGFFDHVRHAFLPAVTLALAGTATYARVMRGEMVETLRSDYVRTARAKGVAPGRVLLSHAVRNAILPVITLIGVSARMLVSGAIITEAVFSWPGIGRLAVEAIAGLDLPVVMGIVFVACLAVQIGNMLSDVAIAALDPRIRDA